MDGLDAWAEEHGVGLPVVPAYCDQTFHLFYLLLPSFATRTRLIEHLKNRGILSVFHYLPLHRSPMANRLRLPSQPCPVTDDVSDRLLRLPLYNDLSPTEQEEVIAAVMEFDRW
jgi:dTDP-4-amino-4,6-dideoxygalactose transaminase